MPERVKKYGVYSAEASIIRGGHTAHQHCNASDIGAFTADWLIRVKSLSEAQVIVNAYNNSESSYTGGSVLDKVWCLQRCSDGGAGASSAGVDGNGEICVFTRKRNSTFVNRRDSSTRKNNISVCHIKGKAGSPVLDPPFTAYSEISLDGITPVTGPDNPPEISQPDEQGRRIVKLAFNCRVWGKRWKGSQPGVGSETPETRESAFGMTPEAWSRLFEPREGESQADSDATVETLESRMPSEQLAISDGPSEHGSGLSPRSLAIVDHEYKEWLDASRMDAGLSPRSLAIVDHEYEEWLDASRMDWDGCLA